MKKIIHNPHSYFKTVPQITNTIQEPPPDYQAPTIIFEADCSISVTYGINPAFKINTKIEEVNGIVKITTKTIRLADNVTTTEYFHIKDNDYYIPYSPYPDYNDPITYTAKLEYETYHITNGIRVSRDYYTQKEADELFLDKQELAFGMGMGTLAFFLPYLFIMTTTWYLVQDLEKDLQPLVYDIGQYGSQEKEYAEYEVKCINEWKKCRSYFTLTPDNQIYIGTYQVLTHLQATGPRIRLRFIPSRGLKGDRGLDAFETSAKNFERLKNPNYVNPDCAEPSRI